MQTHYVFDEAGHLLAEHDGATGAVLREYVWLDDTPVAMIDSTGTSPVTYFIHTGQIEEPLVMTDAAQNKVWDAYVEPFGQAQVFGTPSAGLDLRLPGQFTEAETGGLNQNWNRNYDTSLGRYIEADPLGIDAGQNVYGYVRGNPLNSEDPDGRFIWVLAGAGIGAVVNITVLEIETGGHASGRQVLAAGLGGAAAGALGALAGPLGGTVALELGAASNGFLATTFAAGLSAGGSGLGQEISNLIDPCHTGSVLNAAFWGGIGGGLAKGLFPTRNLNTLAQAVSFGPKTIPGLFRSANAAINLGSFTAGSAVGAASSAPGLGPF